MCRVDHLGDRQMYQRDTHTTITQTLRRSFCSAIPPTCKIMPRHGTGLRGIPQALKPKRRVWPGDGG